DHLPHPGALLSWLDRIYQHEKLPALTFHLYGDFTFHAGSWIALAVILSRVSSRLICASERQAALISRLLNAKIDICPFPLRTREYSFDPQARARWRKSLRIGKRDFVIGYTGRMSLQKNVLELV